MFLSCKKIGTFVATLSTLCGTVHAGHGSHAPVQCAPGVNCVPKRVTFGYAAPTWRRWPTDNVVDRVPESVPTPAKDTTPTVEPEGPKLPDKETLPDPSVPSTAPEIPSTPSFEDSPPTPPLEDAPTTPSNPTTPADDLPQPPTETPITVPGDDSPPTMPEDDPFKDDPEIAPPPTEEPKSSSRGGASRVLQQAAAQSRSALARGLQSSRPTEGKEGEPRRLSLESDEAPILPLSHETPALEAGNRLRPSARPVREASTQVRSAGEGRQGVPASATVWRSNPLRAGH